MKRVLVLLAVLGLFAMSCSTANKQPPSSNITVQKTAVEIVTVPSSVAPIAETSLAPTDPTPNVDINQTPPMQFEANPIAVEDSTLSLQIISVASPIHPGESAILRAHTTPGANCKISVYYTSNRSAAGGLVDKTAEASGNVSWTWKVGTDMKPGTYRIEVTASQGGKSVSQTTFLTVSPSVTAPS